jgi:hypothetical protein
MIVLQRLGGGIAWLALVAASLYLLRPDLFPDVKLPADLATLLASPNERWLIGLMVGLVTAAIGLGGLLEIFRSFGRR